MLRMLCGLHSAVIRILITPRIRKPFTENSSSLYFSVASPLTHHIRGGRHKDITDAMDVFTAENYDP